MRFLIFCSGLLGFSLALAADKQTLQHHADTFLMEQQLLKYSKKADPAFPLPVSVLRQLKMQRHNCVDNGGTSPKSCIETVCSKLSKHDCDDISEIQVIAKMCKNNVDGDCVDAVCSKLSKYDCDDTSELKHITNMCAGHFSAKCLDIACSHLDKYSCDDLSEVQVILKTACTPDVDPDCIATVCSKMSKYDCDDLSEIQKVAKACSGN